MCVYILLYPVGVAPPERKLITRSQLRSLPLLLFHMAKTGDGAHRFMQALAAMLLVAGCLPCAVGNDGSSAAAVQQKAKIFEEAGRGGGAAVLAVAALPAAEAESPGSLLDRGTALVNEGNSREAVGVLDAAIALWEEEVSGVYMRSDFCCVTHPYP